MSADIDRINQASQSKRRCVTSVVSEEVVVSLKVWCRLLRTASGKPYRSHHPVQMSNRGLTLELGMKIVDHLSIEGACGSVLVAGDSINRAVLNRATILSTPS